MTTKSITLKRRSADKIPVFDREPVDPETRVAAREIVTEVRDDQAALRRYAEKLDGLPEGAPLVLERSQLDRACDEIEESDRELLERTAERIDAFATAQRGTLDTVTVAVPGGRAGQEVAAVSVAGCYAPGGRYPLPSSVLMTAVTARAAGVEEIWVASPNPGPLMRAAAAIAGADGMLCAGGAHAIAAMAYGCGGVSPCAVIVGPGNRWVTAAKQVVSGRVAIDLLAGPSELVVLADGSADPCLIAADLLAQAEHDPEALPVLVALEEGLIESVEEALGEQLSSLPTRDIAVEALKNGYAVLAEEREEAVALCNRLAPEHLQVMTRDPGEWAERLDHYGALFIGSRSAEVFGDYGVGPNHTLPTGGSARAFGGLSVFSFLRIRTWLELDEADPDLIEDTARLARLEGLEAHARAAEARRG